MEWRRPPNRFGCVGIATPPNGLAPAYSAEAEFAYGKGRVYSGSSSPLWEGPHRGDLPSKLVTPQGSYGATGSLGLA
jgi:hypothetical protein